MRTGTRFSAASAAAGLALVTGCAQAVETDPAPTASDPVCAEVVMALPQELGGLEQRSTTSQSSRAWGDPAVALRCGVIPPGPSTEQCLEIIDGAGTSVDWIALEDEDGGGTFITYGREPAVEMTVPPAYAGDQAGAMLTEVGSAVATIPQERACL